MEQREENVKEQTAPAEEKSRNAVTADFIAIFHDVLKNLWVAVLVGISVAFLAYAGTYITYHPQYVSQTTFVVSARGSNTGAYAIPVFFIGQMTDRNIGFSDERESIPAKIRTRCPAGIILTSSG